MKLIFWGLLFLFIDININTVSLTPAFVGYILFYVGLGRVTECHTFARSRTWALVAAVYSGVFWLLNCFGMSVGGVIGVVCGLVSILFQLLLPYRIAQGILELEEFYHTDLRGYKLKRSWCALAVGVLASFVFGWTPLAPLAVAALIVFVVAAIYYIVMFYKSWKAYDNTPKQAEGGNEPSNHF